MLVSYDYNEQCTKMKLLSLQKDYPLSWTNVNSSGNLIGKGIAFEIMETLREKFGFTYQVVTPSRNLLGDANNGIFGMLHSGVSVSDKLII